MNTENLSTQKMNKYGVDFAATLVVVSFPLKKNNGANDVF